MLWQLIRADTVYVLYVFTSDPIIRASRSFGKKTIAQWFGLRKKTIAHWIGSDVLLALRQAQGDTTYLSKFGAHHNLAVSPLLVSELASMGLAADLVPLLPYHQASPESGLPERHAVLVYLPKGKELFYGRDLVSALATSHPEIPFRIVSSDSGEIDQPNVHYYGRVSEEVLSGLYDQTSILLRLTEHDGMPFMVLEALLKGKSVLYSFDFPHVVTPRSRSIDDVRAAFDKLVARPPARNVAGTEYVQRNFNSDRIWESYRGILY